MADNDGDSDEARTLGPLPAAAWTCRMGFGPRAGQGVLKLKTPWRDGSTRWVMSPLALMQRRAAQAARRHGYA